MMFLAAMDVIWFIRVFQTQSTEAVQHFLSNTSPQVCLQVSLGLQFLLVRHDGWQGLFETITKSRKEKLG